jgi:hypothetical protein
MIQNFSFSFNLGKPNPSVKWYKDGKEIEANKGNYKIEYIVDSGLASLMIKNINKENQGRFTCVARNSIGSCSTSALINVIGKFVKFI